MNIDSDNEDANAGGMMENLEDLKQVNQEEEDDDAFAAPGKTGVKLNWPSELDVEFSDDEEEETKPVVNNASKPATAVISSGVFVQKEDPVIHHTKKNSNIAGELIAVGLFKEAQEKLETQIGMKSSEAISHSFCDIFLGSQMFYSTMSFAPVQTQFILNPNQKDPYVSNTLRSLEKKLKLGYKKTTEGAFEEGLAIFKEIITSVPLMSVVSKADVTSVEKLLSIATEYALALSCDLEKKKAVRI